MLGSQMHSPNIAGRHQWEKIAVGMGESNFLSNCLGLEAIQPSFQISKTTLKLDFQTIGNTMPLHPLCYLLRFLFSQRLRCEIKLCIVLSFLSLLYCTVASLKYIQLHDMSYFPNHHFLRNK